MNDITPFERTALAPRGNASQATMVEQSRAVAEVQAAVVVAQQRPRDQQSALKEMREVCTIERLAEKAFFRFSRGGGQVNGESVHLARELARCWGNVVYGLVELSRNDAAASSEMMAFAWDMQTNARSQTVFIVPHMRDTKGGAKQLTDMRDIYENNANMGARRLREMIFAVLPVWFREEAADICRHTIEHGGGKPLVQRIADCVKAFEGLGITRGQLEKKQGRRSAVFTAEDVASLGVVYRSIKAGEVLKDDEFPREEIEAPANADAFEAASGGKAKPPAKETDTEAATAAGFLSEIAALEAPLDVTAWTQNEDVKAQMGRWKKDRPDLFKLVGDEVAGRTQGMSKLATLRVTVPVDDGVKLEDVQTRLREMLRGMTPTRHAALIAEALEEAEIQRKREDFVAADCLDRLATALAALDVPAGWEVTEYTRTHDGATVKLIAPERWWIVGDDFDTEYPTPAAAMAAVEEAGG